MILASIGVILLIFIINVIPAFMPPTWMLLSFVGFNFNLSGFALIILSILAAVASTSGRTILALLSSRLIRNKILSPNAVANVDFIKHRLENKKIFTFGFFLFFAFSPFPSGPLFLAYGLTGLKLRIAAVPFFIGRAVSYLFWALTASGVSEMLDLTSSKSELFFGLGFVLAQALVLYLVYLFIKIDWRALFEEHTIRFVKI